MGIKKNFNEYIIDGDIAKIIIIRLNGEKFEVLVDADKIPFLQELNYSWCINKDDIHNSYARYTWHYIKENGEKATETRYLHHVVMEGWNYNQYIVYDHANRNTLDNRVKNLRVVDKHCNDKNRKGKNSNNRSGHRNVSWNKSINKWVIQLQIDGKNKILGSFEDLDEAGRFAKEMRIKYYGEFAGKD